MLPSFILFLSVTSYVCAAPADSHEHHHHEHHHHDASAGSHEHRQHGDKMDKVSYRIKIVYCAHFQTRLYTPARYLLCRYSKKYRMLSGH